MKVIIEKISKEKEEQVTILCHGVSKEVAEIEHFVKTRQEGIEAYDEDYIQMIPLSDICYVEAVDDRVFAYLEHKVYEVKLRLYEFEQVHGDKQFFRCSKAVIVNLMKIQSIKSALNGRFAAILTNGETVIISRKFVPELKERLHGGQYDE